MFQLSSDEKANQFGDSLTITVGSPAITFTGLASTLDQERVYRGGYKGITMAATFKTDAVGQGSKSKSVPTSMAYCSACFNVKKEGGELKSGTQGIGACVYYDANKALYVGDGNFFGTVEATGSDAFKFLPKNKNDWSYEGMGGF